MIPCSGLAASQVYASSALGTYLANERLVAATMQENSFTGERTITNHKSRNLDQNMQQPEPDKGDHMRSYMGDEGTRYQVEILGSFVCPDPAKMSRHESMILSQ